MFASSSSFLERKHIIASRVLVQSQSKEESVTMKTFVSSSALLALLSASPLLSGAGVSAFHFGGKLVNLQPALVGSASTSSSSHSGYASSTRLHESSTEGEDAVAEADAALKSMPVEEQKEKIGNLVADDEWMGLSMEITELVRTAIIEDVKSKTSDFIGKDEYKVSHDADESVHVPKHLSIHYFHVKYFHRNI